MKRIISFLMALVVLVTSIGFQGAEASAASNPQIYSENMEAEAGKVISVPIYISGNQGIMGFTIYISYDKEAFTPIEVTSSELLSAGIINDSIETSKTNTFQVTWAGSSDMLSDGILFHVSFRVAEEARGDYSLGVSYDQPDTFNESWEDVALDCKDVAVSVAPPVIHTVYLSSTDFQETEDGRRIGVPINIANNTGIGQLAVDLRYNTSVFRFEEAEYGLAAKGEVQPDDKGLHMELSGIDTSKSEGTLLMLYFSVDEYVGGKYAFTIESGDLRTLKFFISVNNTHKEEDVKVYGGTPVRKADGVIEVPVLMKNNPGIMGMRMEVEYDSKVLTPINVKQGPLLKGNFDHNIGLSEGKYSILWNTTEDICGNIPLFVASFRVAEQADAASTVISLSYSQPDTFNEAMEDVKLECQDIVLVLQQPVTGIKVEPSSLELYEGETGELAVKAEPEDAYCDDVEWSSSDSAVASVDEKGKVTALKKGLAVIRAEAKDGSGQAASCTVAVKERNIQPEKQEQVLVGTKSYKKTYGEESFRLDASLEKGDGALSYRSKNEAVASVDGEGRVTIQGAGRTVIEVQAQETALFHRAVMQVQIVVDKAEQAISKELSKDSIKVGEKARLTASAQTGKISYRSKDEEIASINEDGVITGIAPGKAVIEITGEEDGNYRLAVAEVEITVVERGEDTGDWEWTEREDGTASISGYMGNDTQVEVPSMLDEREVTQIGDDVFSYNTAITSIVIPNTVKVIRSGAFSGCSSLSQITLSESLESIGEEAFRGSGIKEVRIPDSVTSIGERVFYYCENLENVVLPGGLKIIAEGMFTGCNSLKEIEIPNQVSVIANCAFDSCEGLETVQFSNSLEEIGEEAFRFCQNLKEIEISSKMKSIGKDAFYYCKSMRKAVFLAGVETIGKEAFYFCESLREVQFPMLVNIGEKAFAYCSGLQKAILGEGLVNVGDSAFYSCDRLEDIILPNSLTRIENQAFGNCYYVTEEGEVKGLASISIPENVIFIGSNAFWGCSALEKIDVAERNAEFCSMDGILFNKAKTELLYFPEGKHMEEYEIPSSVQKLGDYAFAYIDVDMENISIVIPDTIREIGAYAFYNCYLGNIKLPKDLKSIGGYAFRYSLYEEIEIPSGVTYIGEGAFSENYYLTSINVDAANPSFCSQNGVLFNKAKTELITYPGGMEGEKYSVPSGVTRILLKAFSENWNLKEVLLPKSVSKIERYAFKNTNLTDVTILNPQCVIGNGSDEEESYYDEVFSSGVKIHGYEGSTAQAYAEKYEIPFEVITEEICEHEYKGVVTTPSTCTQKGMKTFTCSKCGDSYTEELPLAAHEYTSQVTRPSTCTQKGVKTFTCSECGDSYTEDLPLTEHEYTSQVTRPSTCEKKGVKTFTCNVCGDSYTEDLPLTEHEYTSQVTRPSTCAQKGIKTFTCSECGDSYTEELPLTAEHKYTDQITRPSTCTQKGIRIFTCSICKDSYTEELPLGGHTYTEQVTRPSTCSQKGVKEYTCGICGDSYTELLPVVGHDYQRVTVKATTSKNGSIQKKCKFCGDVSEAVPIAYPKTVALSKSSVTYTGKAQKVSVKVKDSAGRAVASANYSVSYSSNKNVGEATVTVKFKGNYTGSVKKTFRILPKGTSLSKVSAKPKGFSAKWKKQASQTNGYQIQYSTNSKFKGKDAKTVSIKKNRTTSKSVSKLKAKKKYYVRIRTYKTVKIKRKNVTLYSAWSKAKTVKTKK